MGKRARHGYRTGDFRFYAGAPGTLPVGFTLADHRIADIADFPRLFAVVGQAWRLGGDTYNTGTQFRIPDGTRLMRGASWSAVAPYTYALDALAAELMGPPASFAGALTMSAGSQIGSYAAQGGLGANAVFAAAPANFSTGTSAKLDTALGNPQDIEFVLTLPDLSGLPAGGVILAAAAMLLNAGTFATMFRVQVDGVAGSNLLSVTYYNSTGQIAQELNIPAGAHRVTLEMDSTTSTMQVRRNGAAPLVLSSDTYAPAQAVAVFQVQEYAGADPAIAGLVASVEIVPDAADILYPITVGATDFNGTATGGGAITSDVGTRAGSATSGAHALTLAEMPIHSHELNVDVEGFRSPADYNNDTYHTAATGGGGSTLDAGEGDAHSHTIDPEHVKVLVLVKT